MNEGQTRSGSFHDPGLEDGRVREFGVVAPEVLASMSGLDALRAMVRGELPGPPIAQTLQFVLTGIERGKAVFTSTPTRAHYNPLGMVHGGYHATLLDSALGCAVHSTLPAGRGYTTLELKINFVRSLTDAVGTIRAEAEVVHVGKQVATAEGRIVDAEGRLYSHGSTTCLIFDART